jgi:capsular exopolysaccharide synthesis family protein
MATKPPSHSGNGALPASHGSGPLYDEALLEVGAQSSSLREWIGLLWSGKWVILGVCLLAVLGTGLYIYSIPHTYRTSALLYINDREESVVSDFGRRSSSFMQQDRRLENELFLLRNSNVIADRVARRLQDLKRHPQTGDPLPILVGPEGDSLTTGAVAGRVQGSMRAYPASEEVNAMRVNITSSTPTQAALIANLYAETYIARTKERSRESKRASRQFLEAQAEKLQKDVEGIEGRIEEYMQTHEAVSLDQASSRVVGRISELETRRSELQIDLDMKRAALRDLKAELADAEPKLAEQLSSSLNEQLQRVQKEKAELENRIDLVERRNPGINGGGTKARELERMRARVNTLQRKADSLAQAYVEESLAAGVGGGEETSGVGAVAQKQQRASQLRIEVSGLDAQLNVVEQRLAEQRSKLRSIPEQSMELAQLQRERRSTEQIYGYVREKLQEIRLAEESKVGFAEIVQAAPTPRVPLGPDLPKNLVLALFLGAGLGAAIVVVWAKLDTHVRQPDDLKSKGYSLAGVVPPMEELIQNQFGGNDRIEVDGQSVSTELVILTSPMSAAAEAYRRVRANLQFARPDATVQAMAITSAEQGEGKTTTASNLALAFASAGKETLVIDADLRHPRLHSIFDVPQEPGLSHLLFDRSIDQERFATGIDHLSVLPAGETVPNPAELLGSERMRGLLIELRDAYDIVLIDTPPVLLFSDAMVLSSHCEGTLLVAAAGTSDGRAVDHAAEQVGEVDGRLLGCVLNRYEGGSSLYGYGSNYGYARGHQELSKYYREAKPEGNVE